MSYSTINPQLFFCRAKRYRVTYVCKFTFFRKSGFWMLEIHFVSLQCLFMVTRMTFMFLNLFSYRLQCFNIGNALTMDNAQSPLDRLQTMDWPLKESFSHVLQWKLLSRTVQPFYTTFAVQTVMIVWSFYQYALTTSWEFGCPRW